MEEQENVAATPEEVAAGEVADAVVEESSEEVE